MFDDFHDNLQYLISGLLIFNILLFGLNFLLRLSKSADTRRKKETAHLLAILGSGGHTTEMIRLIKSLSDKYTPRTYVLANTDKFSLEKEFEQSRNTEDIKIELIPRSREVGQIYLTAVYSTLWASYSSLRLLFKSRPDVILCNGPGTGLPICIIAHMMRTFGFCETKVIFIESICRVKTLSLTGLILYHTRMVSVILVQWEELTVRYPRVKYIGRFI